MECYDMAKYCNNEHHGKALNKYMIRLCLRNYRYLCMISYVIHIDQEWNCYYFAIPS